MSKVPTLLSTVQRLRGLIGALTVTDEGGRLIRDGIDAQAISLGVDQVFEASARHSRRWFRAKAQRVHELPPGIQLMGSDSPDGPFEPVPLSDMNVSIASVGKDGIPPTAIAISRRIERAVGFSAAKWNAMQAQRPGGDHCRFHAGEIISNEAIEMLAQAEELIQLDSGGVEGEASDGREVDQCVKIISLQFRPVALESAATIDSETTAFANLPAQVSPLPEHDKTKEALRNAILKRGVYEKAKNILRTARVRDEVGRRVLRELEASGEYQGFGRDKSRRYGP